MIAKLTGRVDSTGDGWAIIDVGGVGYLVFCSGRTLTALSAESGIVSLFIETNVREDHIHLYGFVNAAEQAWYRILTTVQGVGAKVGLGMLSALSPDQLAQAIVSQDVAALTQAPGVGKKLATRVVSELKDKIGDLALQPFAAASGPTGATLTAVAGDGMDQTAVDAISALVNLGYGRSEAFGAVTRANAKHGEGVTVEALITDGLAELSMLEASG